MRYFLAVDLPDPPVAGVAAVQDWLSNTDGPRFTDPKSAHVTLKFLGEVPPDRVGAVGDVVEPAIEVVGVGPFDTSVGEPGVFLSLDHIRVVWVGVDDGVTELTRLHEVIERETTALGFDLEDHEFTPHAALACMDDVRGKVLVWRVVGGESPTVGSFRVCRVHLKKSDLGPNGPEYETVARVSPRGASVVGRSATRDADSRGEPCFSRFGHVDAPHTLET